MSLASPLGNRGLPVRFPTDPTFPSGSTVHRYGRLQMNRVAAALPAFRTEGSLVSLQKIVIGSWTSVHPCRQVQLLFEGCQFGGKFEVVAFCRENFFLQIKDQPHQLAVGGVSDYFPDLFERVEWVHLRIMY